MLTALLVVTILISISGLVLISDFVAKGSLSHSAFLLAGFSYYVIMPFWVYNFSGYDGPASEMWQDAFYHVINHFWFHFFIIICVVILPYAVGRKLPCKPILKRIVLAERPASAKVFLCFSSLLLLLNLYSIFTVRHLWGVGYTGEYRHDLYGTVVSSTLLVLYLNLYVADLLHKEYSRLFANIRLASLVMLALSSVCLLSLGVRAYGIIILVSLASQHFLYSQDTGLFRNKIMAAKDRIAVSKSLLIRIITFLLIPVLAVSIVFFGLQRQRISGLSENFTNFFMAESLLTSMTLRNVNPSCLDELEILISYPHEIVKSFIVLVPRFIFPNKDSLIGYVSECYYSPFGAQHIQATLILTSGAIGSIALILAFSWYFRVVETSSRNTTSFWLYSVLCATCLSFVFRELLPNLLRLTVFYPMIFRLILFQVNRIK